jgi:hypothetical protein
VAEFILATENMAGDSDLLTTIKGITNPNLKVANVKWAKQTPLSSLDIQPHIEVVITAPKNAGKAIALIDSGGCFTRVSKEFCDFHALKMKPFACDFKQADNLPSGRLIGKVDFTM